MTKERYLLFLPILSPHLFFNSHQKLLLCLYLFCLVPKLSQKGLAQHIRKYAYNKSNMCALK